MISLKKSSFHIWIIVLGLLFVGNSLAWSGTVTNEMTTTQYADLQEAINSASSGDVLLLEGTFTGSFLINGPSLGITELTLKGTSATEQAIIDAQKEDRVLEVLGAQTGNKLSVILENLIFQNGVATANSSNGPYGGGIFNQFANLTLSAVLLNNNSADEYGGGLTSYYSNETSIINSKIQNNSGKIGGGISILANTSCNISETSFTGNFASLGGAINFFFSSNNIISSCTINDNGAGSSGGGIYNDFSVTQVINSDIDNNSAGTFGGGLYNTNQGTVEFKYVSTVNHNVAGSNGGGIYNGSGAYFELSAKSEVVNNTPNDIFSASEL